MAPPQDPEKFQISCALCDNCVVCNRNCRQRDAHESTLQKAGRPSDYLRWITLSRDNAEVCGTRIKGQKKLQAGDHSVCKTCYEAVRAAGKQGTTTSNEDVDSADAESWDFKCVCGAEGHDFDDGKPMIDCDECKVYQHTRCNGINKRPGKSMSWICSGCQQGKEDGSQQAPKKARMSKKHQTQSTVPKPAVVVEESEPASAPLDDTPSRITHALPKPPPTPSSESSVVVEAAYFEWGPKRKKGGKKADEKPTKPLTAKEKAELATVYEVKFAAVTGTKMMGSTMSTVQLDLGPIDSITIAAFLGQAAKQIHSPNWHIGVFVPHRSDGAPLLTYISGNHNSTKPKDVHVCHVTDDEALRNLLRRRQLIPGIDIVEVKGITFGLSQAGALGAPPLFDPAAVQAATQTANPLGTSTGVVTGGREVGTAGTTSSLPDRLSKLNKLYIPVCKTRGHTHVGDLMTRVHGPRCFLMHGMCHGQFDLQDSHHWVRMAIETEKKGLTPTDPDYVDFENPPGGTTALDAIRASLRKQGLARTVPVMSKPDWGTGGAPREQNDGNPFMSPLAAPNAGPSPGVTEPMAFTPDGPMGNFKPTYSVSLSKRNDDGEIAASAPLWPKERLLGDETVWSIVTKCPQFKDHHKAEWQDPAGEKTMTFHLLPFEMLSPQQKLIDVPAVEGHIALYCLPGKRTKDVVMVGSDLYSNS